MNIPIMKQTLRGVYIILTRRVEITWHSSNTAHYRGCGYEFTKVGDKFLCRVCDLTRGSHAVITVQCPVCHRIRSVEYKELVKAGHSICRGCTRANDLTNIVFGRLTVLEMSTERTASGHIKWVCRCDCGEIKSVAGNSLLIGHTKSCGCYNKDILRSQTGEASNSWNPNLTDEERLINRNYFEYTEWRNLVYERDEYTCQSCGDDRGGNLNAHHLYSYSDYPDYRVSLRNGITLCRRCHNRFHKWMGGPHIKCTPEDYYRWSK